jgi:hypothetical protein
VLLRVAATSVSEFVWCPSSPRSAQFLNLPQLGRRSAFRDKAFGCEAQIRCLQNARVGPLGSGREGTDSGANRAKINVKVVSKNLFSNTVQLDDLDKNLVVPKSGWGNEALLKGFPRRLFAIHTDGFWMV